MAGSVDCETLARYGSRRQLGMKQFPEHRFVAAPHFVRGFFVRGPSRRAVLLAYIDEVGEPGAFVSPDHKKYHTSAAFGYAGFIIPEDAARDFGARFAWERNTLFRSEVAAAKHQGRWERKGASIFRSTTPERCPQQLRVFNALVKYVRAQKGMLFYYVDEKPLGTPRQTHLNSDVCEAQAMEECLNRLARHADGRHENILVMIDQINEKTRAGRLPKMYSHILGRANQHPEMRRIVEPPCTLIPYWAPTSSSQTGWRPA